MWGTNSTQAVLQLGRNCGYIILRFLSQMTLFFLQCNRSTAQSLFPPSRLPRCPWQPRARSGCGDGRAGSGRALCCAFSSLHRVLLRLEQSKGVIWGCNLLGSGENTFERKSVVGTKVPLLCMFFSGRYNQVHTEV